MTQKTKDPSKKNKEQRTKNKAKKKKPFQREKIVA